MLPGARFNFYNDHSSSNDALPYTSEITRIIMTANLDDDEYVAVLLKQDAKQATKKYELVGIDAFNPRRCVTSLIEIASYSWLSFQST